MNKIIKKLSFFLIAVVTITVCFNVYAYAIKTDGAINEHEWNDATVFVLDEQKNFNNKIKSSVVKVLENRQDGFVYLAVMTEFEKCGDINDCKVKVAVNDSNPSVISIGEGIIENGTYPVEAASTADANSGCAFTEIAVFFKDGAKRSDIIKINIFDMKGTESGTYIIELEDDEEISEEAESADEKDKKESSSKTTKAGKTRKTSSKKSSSVKTTKIDDFTFKKVDKSKTEAEDIVDESGKKESVSETEQSQTVYEEEEKTFNKKYFYLIIGAVCAAGIAVAAVAVASKSNKKDE